MMVWAYGADIMWKWVKRCAAGMGALLLLLLAVLLINTIRYSPPEIASVKAAEFEVNVARAAQDLSRAVTFETDSTKPDSPDFDAFIDWLPRAFPRLHASTTRVLIAEKTPLYQWTGSDPNLKPVLFAAHYDVVPILQPTLSQWVHPPYSGFVDDKFVWGRGTLDNKGALITMLHAAEKLMGAGFQPKRTIYFSFGHDEEVRGAGAAAVAKFLGSKNIQLDWILDEGSFVLDKIIPGLEKPVASINLAEKGVVTLSLIARSAGGHSSMPPKETAVGILARAIDRLQQAPVPGGLTGVSAEFFDRLGRHFSFGRRIIFANTWLFGPILEGILSDAPSTNAMLRTTTAPTMLSGSDKVNVLPVEAVAKVNFRIHPRDTFDSIVSHVSRTIDDDRVSIRVEELFASPASPVSDKNAQGYLDIRASILDTFGPIATVPGLTIAATDARLYARAADNAYRINPFKITGDDLTRFHGTNERLSLENIEKGIRFYHRLMERQ